MKQSAVTLGRPLALALALARAGSQPLALALLALAGCGVKLPASAGIPGGVASGDPVTLGPEAAEPAHRGAYDDPTTMEGAWAVEMRKAEADPDRGNCAIEVMPTARSQGLVGPCWDPPGDVRFAPPIHVTPGMRTMAPDLYWFDMPAEAEPDRNQGCAELPSARGGRFKYEPYSDDGGRPQPAIPDLTGKTVDEALATLDALDAPLCVMTIVWTSNCDAVDEDAVCQQNFDRSYAKLNLIVRSRQE